MTIWEDRDYKLHIYTKAQRNSPYFKIAIVPWSLHSWFFLKIELFLRKSKLTGKLLLHSLCMNFRTVKISLCVKSTSNLIFSPSVLILVNKQSVNNPQLTEAFGPFASYSFYLSNFGAIKGLLPRFPQFFLFIRCAVLMSELNKRSHINFYCLENIFVLSSCFNSNTSKKVCNNIKQNEQISIDFFDR